MIHIACNIDANFIQHCAVTLVSLFENNKRADICVHIVAPYLSEADQAILRNLAAPYGNEVCFYYPPKELLQCFSIKKFGKRISMATYYRCMFSSILPREFGESTLPGLRYCNIGRYFRILEHGFVRVRCGLCRRYRQG